MYSYKWCEGSSTTLTKYCNSSSFGYQGYTDTRTALDPEDDAVHVNLGGNWRMPTDAEWTELMNNCTWTQTTRQGVKGRLVTASNGNSIFLPSAGYRRYTDLSNAGVQGLYSSSSLCTDTPSSAMCVSFGSDNVVAVSGSISRVTGLSIRPVLAE